MPGHILIYRQGRFEIKEYFHPYLEPKNDPAGEIEAEALQNRLRGVLRDSVEHHMLSDVEVGAFLSGGVDSGYLAAVSGADQALTVGFDEGEHYSEVDRAKEVAQQAGLKHHIRIIGKQEFWDSLPDVMYYMDEPLGDASAVALYFLAEEASRYVKVVLGEGADELFGGYNIYREPDSLKAVSWIPRGIRRKIGQLAAKFPDIKGRDFLIRAGMSVEERFIGNAYIYREKEKQQILRNPIQGPSTREFMKPFYTALGNQTAGKEAERHGKCSL